jgi:dephospho-CoA kinase
VTVRAPFSRVVGLTGGIASGKSTVADVFGSYGVNVIDVDDISRSLTAAGGRALPDLNACFPSAFDGAILNRAKLREIVFADPSKRHALEAILHPMIHDEAKRRLSSIEAKRAPYTLLVVPLLFENDRYREVIDCAIVVDVPRATQIERLVSKRKLSVLVAEQIVATQFSREERLSRAQFVIENSGSPIDAQQRVARLHQTFLATYASIKPTSTAAYAAAEVIA